MLAVANEFFDALPVRQFVRAEAGWRERLIDHAPDRAGFRFTLAAETLRDEAVLPVPLRDAPPGALVEAAPDRARLARAVGERLAAQGGATLIVDYGHAPSAPGDTFQAVRRHAYADPLAEPGEADLTAHVDFEALADAARAGGAAISGPVEQGPFLRRLGIVQRAEGLAAARPDRKATLALALRRLTASDQMGALFKVLAIRDPRLSDLPGFEPA
jgi:NADH dehydrogenase [ubiquinone] 1 alpha subcomplex assembly factor 7